MHTTSSYDPTSPVGPTRSARARRYVALLVGVALLAAACGDSGDEGSSDSTAARPSSVEAAEERVAEAEDALDEAQDALDGAHEQFCDAGEEYISAIDRYGKLFTSEAATVGDLEARGDDLAEPRDDVSAAASDLEAAADDLTAAEQELVDAQAALAEARATASSVTVETTEPPETTTTTLVPEATIERVRSAEEALADVSEGITDTTPIVDATVEFNSAAFALEITWIKLIVDAGCLSDDQLAEAVQAVTDYTVALQTQLQLTGHFTGEVDGIYGPATVAAVKALQADSGLRETGLVDAATARALDDLVGSVDEIAATEMLTQTAALQTVLTLTGYWTGPIDGQWTDELTQALVEFQTELGVPPTGAIDAATLAAFQEALAELDTDEATTTTTSATPTTDTTEGASG